jgi:NADPH:quinone reductase-like Zn-dependent oxidoreductase
MANETMQALQISRHGPHAELRPTSVEVPPLKPGEVRVAVQAAAINPSDIVSAEGRFPGAPLPRILGRDFAGRVVDGPPELVGLQVWGTGGDLGVFRDGTHAEFLTLPMDAVSARPSSLSAEEAAAAGVPFTTAWLSLIGQGHLQAGEWVIVSGAAGAVGWAAVQLAAAREARVIALVRNDEEAARLDRNAVSAVARSERGELTSVVSQATSGRGADLALNGVGAPLFQPLMDALSDGGRMAIYSAAAGREATLDLFTLYRRRLQLLGVNTAGRPAAEGARILTELRPLFESKALRPHPVLERYPLTEAARAYGRVAQGAQAKVVLTIPGT